MSIDSVTSRWGEIVRRLLPRGATQLAAAGLASQVISLVAMPVVARTAGTHALGLLQAYLTVTTFASVLACLRFDYALLQPRSEGTALQLAGLGALASVGCGGLTWAIMPLAAETFGTTAWHELSSLAWGVGAAVALAGLSATTSQWMVRSGNFTGLSRARWIQALATAGGQMIASFAGWGGTGLILVDTTGRLTGLVALLAASNLRLAAASTDLSPAALRSTLREFRRFPFMSAPSSLINAAGFSLPAFIIERFYGVGALGIYSLIERVMGLPSTLIGSPLAQTFAHRLRTTLDTAPGGATTELRSTARLALILGLPFFGAIAVCGASLFVLAFGETWRSAGALAQWLTLPYAVAYVVWPVMVTLTILNRLRLQLFWEASRLVAMLVLLDIAARYLPPFEAVVAGATGLMAVFGLIHFRLCLRASLAPP